MRYQLKSKVGEANAALCFACVAFTIVFFTASASTIHVLVGDSFAVYEGKYWLLVSNVTVHGSGMHLIFNLMWLWVLGNAMEEALGSVKFMTFVVTAAFVSSGFQLISSVSTGIGISGVICAMAGFIWATRRDVPMFGAIMPDQRLSRFIVILLVMIPLDHFIKSFNIAHYAHFGGLAFGLAVGRASSQAHTGRDHLQGVLATVLMVGFVSTSLVWAPWSGSWRTYQARKQEIKDFQTAMDVFENLSYQQEKRIAKRVEELVGQVSAEALPMTDRIAAMIELRQYPSEDAMACVAGNVLLGGDDSDEVAELVGVKTLIQFGENGTPAVLRALEVAEEPRRQEALVHVLAAVHSPSRAKSLIKSHMARSGEVGRKVLKSVLERMPEDSAGED